MNKIFVFLVFSPLLHASPLCFPHDPSYYMEARLNPSAQAAVTEGQRLIDLPSLSLVRVLNASTDWQDRGQLNFGVFEIAEPGGMPVVLKIIDGDQFIVRDSQSALLLDFDGELRTHGGKNLSASGFKEYVDVHTLLGKMHTAPKLIGIVTASNLKRAFQSQWSFLREAAEILEFDTAWITKPRLAGNQAIGVVMQRLPMVMEQGSLHPLNRPTQPHPFMKNWSAKDVENVARDLIEIRRRVIMTGVQLIDRQFVLTPSARAYLIDLDQARFNPAQAVLLDLSGEIGKVIAQWEATTGLVFSAELHQTLLQEAAKPYHVCDSESDLTDLFSDWRSCEAALSKTASAPPRL